VEKLVVGLLIGLGWPETEVVSVGRGLGAARHLVAQQYPGEIEPDNQGDAEEDHDEDVGHGRPFLISCDAFE
jgi:hypothetical protein